MHKLIVAAGRGRSGSTLMYNLIRLIWINQAGEENVYATGHRRYNQQNNRKYHIVKIHDHNGFLWNNADYIFSCRRNPLDQAESTMKAKWLVKRQIVLGNELIDVIKFDHKRFMRWKGHKNYIKTFEFDELTKNKAGVIKELCKIFGFDTDIDTEAIISAVDNMKPPKKGVDPITNLIPHHMTRDIEIEHKISEETKEQLRNLILK